MFTGIIRDIGQITSLNTSNGDLNLSIKTTLELNKTNIGDSICCGGVCLTVIKIKNDIFNVELSKETLSVSAAKFWKKGTKINIEKSLLLGDQIGGHLVSGHVDSVTVLQSKKNIKGSVRLVFKSPKEIQAYIAKKGSISIDGVSLTINEVNKSSFNVNVISHTFNNTTLGQLNEKDLVNIEIDTIARYAVNAAKYYIKEK
ncbi:riboflavin synthase [Alphaproteobacteria bacterium]|jgi:riboflavin synthase|nr:riboflavin synthase [Alphaproteobacteria bacterium]MDB9971739.1 riboflavin synthase [Alphaproteobacteria bacterium]|tara:strand:+ start:348 stop:950 length:603 start_codon:yes stop_codon:yes gene_type:complete